MRNLLSNIRYIRISFLTFLKTLYIPLPIDLFENGFSFFFFFQINLLYLNFEQRVPGGGGVVVGGGVIGVSATPQGPGVQQHQHSHSSGNNVVHRVVNSRHQGSHHHVKKSDSSQQTDTSAFKQQTQHNISNSSNSNNSNSNSSNSQQWKMYIEAGAARDRDTTGHPGPPSPSPSRRSQVSYFPYL